MSDWDWDGTIHVDYNPPHSAMTFGDSSYQPILFFRNPTERELRNLEHLRSGRSTSGPFPDGWVLYTPGVHDDEYVTGLLDVDEAVDAAKHWLRETLAEEATR